MRCKKSKIKDYIEGHGVQVVYRASPEYGFICGEPANLAR